MPNILVYCEDDALRGELCSKAATLGTCHEATPSGLGAPDENPDTIARALSAAAKAVGADIVMVGHTKRGKDLAPRLAAHLDVPYASEILDIKPDEGWTVDRMVLSGNTRATYTLVGKGVVTALPKVFQGKGSGTPVAAQQAEPSKVKVLERKGKPASDFDLAGATVVVGVGRGFKKQEDLKLAEELAKSFPGGAVGCSRPIAADLKWLGEEHWIGLSGNQIAPKAYIAVGLSGQIQHIAGIRGSKLIVAINTNKDAPIMQVADYAVVADLYQVLPKMTEALRSKVTA
jgi:electron transfer flavoprotein alpha subunit